MGLCKAKRVKVLAYLLGPAVTGFTPLLGPARGLSKLLADTQVLQAYSILADA